MDLINILLFGIILLVAFGDYLITKFKRKSEEKILIGDEKAKHKKPFLNFLSSSTFIVFSSLTLILIIYVATDLSSDLLPDLYFPEVLIAICLASFYTIFSVKTYMSKINRKKIIAREILYFTLNIFMSLILGFTFILIPVLFEKRERKLNSEYKEAKDFEKLLFKDELYDEVYIKNEDLELAKRKEYEVTEIINSLEIKNYSFLKKLIGTYPNYYFTELDLIAERLTKDFSFMEKNIDFSSIENDPRYLESDRLYHRMKDVESMIAFPSLNYLGKIKISKIIPVYKTSKKIKWFKYDYQDVKYISFDCFVNCRGLNGFNEFESYFKRKGQCMHYAFCDNKYYSYHIPKDLPDPTGINTTRICSFWECETKRRLINKKIEYSRSPTKNIDLIRFLKNQPQYLINKNQSDLYSDLINEDNFENWFTKTTLHKSKKKSLKLELKIYNQKRISQKSFVNSRGVYFEIPWGGALKFNIYKRNSPFKDAFFTIFSFAYVYRLLISIIFMIINVYKWAFKTYFN